MTCKVIIDADRPCQLVNQSIDSCVTHNDEKSFGACSRLVRRHTALARTLRSLPICIWYLEFVSSRFLVHTGILHEAPACTLYFGINLWCRSQDHKIARRLVSIAMTDFLCWFPVGLLGALSSQGVVISSEVNVGIAIFVLPLNSALNPFLYTLNTLLERLSQAKEEQLLLLLQKQMEERA